MSETRALSIDEVDRRLTQLRTNLLTLRDATETLDPSSADPLAILSLAQAFDDEATQIQTALHEGPHDRYAALDHALANLATIRNEADDTIISTIDTTVSDDLILWE